MTPTQTLDGYYNGLTLSLRADMPEAGPDVVKQQPIDLLLQEIDNNTFSYVTENGYLGDATSLAVENTVNRTQVQMLKPLYQPRSYEPIFALAPIPVRYADAMEPSALSNQVRDVSTKRDIAAYRQNIAAKYAGTKRSVLQDDFNHDKSAKCLPSDTPSFKRFREDTSWLPMSTLTPIGMALPRTAQDELIGSMWNPEKRPVREDYLPDFSFGVKKWSSHVIHKC